MEGTSSKPGDIPPPGLKTRGLEITRMLTGRACWSLSLRQLPRSILNSVTNQLIRLEGVV